MFGRKKEEVEEEKVFDLSKSEVDFLLRPKFNYELIKCPLTCIDFTPTNGFFIKDLGKKDLVFTEGFQKKINEGYKVHSFNVFGSHVYFLLENAFRDN